MTGRLSAVQSILMFEVIASLTALGVLKLYIMSLADTVHVTATSDMDAVITCIVAGLIVSVLTFIVLRSKLPSSLTNHIGWPGGMATILLITCLTALLMFPFWLTNELGATDVNLAIIANFSVMVSLLALPWALDLSRWLEKPVTESSRAQQLSVD